MAAMYESVKSRYWRIRFNIPIGRTHVRTGVETGYHPIGSEQKILAAMLLDDSPSVNVESKVQRVAGFDGECGRVQDIEDSERDVSTVSDGILQQQKTPLQCNQGWKLTPTTGQKKVTFPSGPLVSEGLLPYFIYTVIFHLPFWQ